MSKRIVIIGIMVLGLMAAVGAVLAREMPNGVDGPILLLRQAATQTPIPSQTPTTHVDLDALLVGSAAHPTASGSADYNIDHNGNSEIEVNVRGLSALTGQSIDVYVDGTLVGSMVIDGNGQGRFEAESDNGQIVPALAIDSTIDLRLGAEVVASSQPLTDDNDDNANDNDDNVNDNDANANANDDNANDNDDNANDNDDNTNDNDDNVNDNDDNANDNDDNVNDNDDNANDNSDDDNVNDNDDNANDNGDDNVNDNDDNANDNGDDNVNDNDDNANDNSDDDNANDNGDDDNANDNDDNVNDNDDNANDNGDDDNANDNDDGDDD